VDRAKTRQQTPPGGRRQRHAAGGDRISSDGSTRIWEVALVLALPAMAWAVWFAIHLDSKKAKT
jgi:hypothetical protein